MKITERELAMLCLSVDELINMAKFYKVEYKDRTILNIVRGIISSRDKSKGE